MMDTFGPESSEENAFLLRKFYYFLAMSGLGDSGIFKIYLEVAFCQLCRIFCQDSHKLFSNEKIVGLIFLFHRWLDFVWEKTCMMSFHLSFFAFHDRLGLPEASNTTGVASESIGRSLTAKKCEMAAGRRT